MRKENLIAVLLAIYFLTYPVIAVDAITINQIDEFNTDTQNWRIGKWSHPSPPQRIPSGGPDGAEDSYLELSSTGAGNAGSKLVVFNTSQWTGNWTGEGVNTIEMDLNNFGATDLVMRLSIDGSGGRFSLQEGIALSAGSGWQHAVFNVRADDFVAVGGTNIDDTLANVSVLRLLHNSAPGWRGIPVEATLGVDNITAYPESFSLNVNLVGNGDVTLDPDGGTYSPGTEVELTAEPDTGWAFSGWSGDLSGSNNPESIIMDSDKTITATFEGLNDYDLLVTIEGSGSVSLDPPGGTYYDGETVEVSATPAPYWEFSSWSGDLNGSINPETIIMNSDKNITAIFDAPDEYNLLVTIEGSGTVSLNPRGGTYYEGETVELSATPDNEWWEFSGWGGDLSGSYNPESIIMNSVNNITATFSLKDTDYDGVPNQQEAAGPNGGDGNDDGFPDYNQPNVASFKAHDGLNDVTIESPIGTTLSACSAQANPHPEDSPWWVEFPYGFFEFSIAGLAPGNAVEVNIYIHDGEEQNTYYKYGPTPDNPNDDQWYKFKFDDQTQTGAEFNGNVITLHFADGQLGDDDLTANGTILDVGGPGVVDSGSGDSTSGGPGTGGANRSGDSTGGVIGGCFVTILAD
jgi:hypothetical protein